MPKNIFKQAPGVSRLFGVANYFAINVLNGIILYLTFQVPERSLWGHRLRERGRPLPCLCQIGFKLIDYGLWTPPYLQRIFSTFAASAEPKRTAFFKSSQPDILFLSSFATPRLIQASALSGSIPMALSKSFKPPG